MDTTSLHGVTGSAQAGVTAASAKPKSPSLAEILNPFAPSTIPKGAGEIASKAEGVGKFAVTPPSIPNPTDLFKGIAQAIEGYGLRLLQVLAGAALVMFGLATLAKGDTPKLGPLG